MEIDDGPPAAPRRPEYRLHRCGLTPVGLREAVVLSAAASELQSLGDAVQGERELRIEVEHEEAVQLRLSDTCGRRTR